MNEENGGTPFNMNVVPAGMGGYGDGFGMNGAWWIVIVLAMMGWGMEHPEEYYEGNSGMRGRSPSTGRYVSREGGQSYTDGYSRGYAEAMSQMQGGNSGHMPMQQNPYYPEPKRW